MIAPLRIDKPTIQQLPKVSFRYSLIFQNQKKEIDTNLKQYVYGADGSLDGDAIQQNWFPTSQHFDFFISHAHDDEPYAKQLANWLFTTFGFTSFIDSQIWGSADELQREIDGTISNNTGNNITYKQAQDTSSHVHAMLTMALMDAIDKSNFFIFIESEQSLRPFEPDMTNSPWLYVEASIANHIARKIRKTTCFSAHRIDESRQNIVHALRIKQYPKLTAQRIYEIEQLDAAADVYDYLTQLKSSYTFSCNK